MPTYTKHYSLEKPSVNEKYDVNVFNSNFEKLDTAINNLVNQFAASSGGGGLPILTEDGTLIYTSDDQDSGTESVEKLPEPSVEYNNECLLYIGPSENGLITNSFYQCIYNESTNTYSWQILELGNCVEGISYSAVSETSDIVGVS